MVTLTLCTASLLMTNQGCALFKMSSSGASDTSWQFDSCSTSPICGFFGRCQNLDWAHVQGPRVVMWLICLVEEQLLLFLSLTLLRTCWHASTPYVQSPIRVRAAMQAFAGLRRPSQASHERGRGKRGEKSDFFSIFHLHN